MVDRDELPQSFLALVDEAFRRLVDEPDAHPDVTWFPAGAVAFVLARDGLEAGSEPTVTASGTPVSVDW
jgi:hypothetical protein